MQGNLLGRVGSMGALNSPWGLAIAPASFTGFAGDLLVGNFGDGTINVFNPDPTTPGFLGTLSGADDKPISIDGLWDLIPGNDGNGGSSQNIYFSAGPKGESDGLFGVLESVQSAPEPGSLSFVEEPFGVRAPLAGPSSVHSIHRKGNGTTKSTKGTRKRLFLCLLCFLWFLPFFAS